MNNIEKYFLQKNEIKFSDSINKMEKKISVKNIKKVVENGNHSLEIKTEELQKLYQEIEKCRKCVELCETRNKVVFGRGNEKPNIVFVGEAPGADEDKQGLPFVGRGGKLFDKWLEKMNLNEPYYIINSIKCRPPANRDPLPEEKENCKDFFIKQLEILNPKIICALGRHGFSNVVDFDLKLAYSKVRRKIHYDKYNNKIPVIATYHPAYILRNPKEEAKVMDDLNFLLTELSKIK